MELIDEKVSLLIEAVARGETEPKKAQLALREFGDSRDYVQSVCDHVWLNSFVESDEEKSRMREFLYVLYANGLVELTDLITKLELDSIPDSVQSVDVLKRKRTQARTKRIYNVPVFNLLSECSEGFAAFTETVWTLSMHPDLESSSPAHVTYLKEVMGKYSLCPNRSLGVMIAILTKVTTDAGKSVLISLMSSLFPANRIESVLRFHLLSFGKTADNSLVGPSEIHPTKSSTAVGKTPQSFMRAIVILHQYQVIELKRVWAFLTPLDTSTIKSSVSLIQEEYTKCQESVSRILAGSLTTSDPADEPPTSPEQRLGSTVSTISNELGVESQKFQLVSQLLHHGLLEDAIPFMKHLQTLFQDIPIGAIDCIGTPLIALINQLIVDEGLSPRILRILKFLGVYVGRDMSLVGVLFSLISEDSMVFDSILPTLSRILLPAIAVSSPNPHLCSIIWGTISKFSARNRFKIYGAWNDAYDTVFPLQLTRQQVVNQTRTLLKRVVKGAQIGDVVSRNSHYQFAKISSTNPIPALRYMLSNIQVHFNYNLIEPYIEVTAKVPSVSQDIAQFLSCQIVSESNKPFLNTSTASVEPWLNHLAEFMGRFYRKHPTCPLDGLMSMITTSLTAQGDVLTSSTPGRVLLEAIIEYMGGFKLVQQLNSEQIESISGGPVLTSLSLAGVTDNRGTSEKAKFALKSALLSQDQVVETMIFSLTNQLDQLVSNQSIARQFMTGGGVKLLGILFDGIKGCLHQLCDFLLENCSLEEYESLITCTEIFLSSQMDEGIAHHVMRPIRNLDTIGNQTISKMFWTLSLSDIHVPEEQYRKHLSLVREKIGAQETAVEKSGDQKDSARSAKRELVRLRDTMERLEEEMKMLVEKNGTVLAAMKSNKGTILPQVFLSECVARRVFLSIPDAVYCAKFVKLLYENKSSGFDLMEFYDLWTVVLSQSVSCCSEEEIKNFSEFVNEMMQYVVRLRGKAAGAANSASTWSSATKINHQQGITGSDLKTAHHRWEDNITQALKEALDNGEWCEKRNCLILISRTCDTFPVIESNALILKSIVEKLVEDQAEDIATLALSLSRKISSLEAKWIDKVAVKQVVQPATTAPVAVLEPPQLEIESMNVDEDASSSKPANKKDTKPAQKKEEVVKRSAPVPEKKNEKQAESSSRTGSKRATPSAQDDANSKRSRYVDDRNDREQPRDRGRSSRNTDQDTIPRSRDTRGTISRR